MGTAAATYERREACVGSCVVLTVVSAAGAVAVMRLALLLRSCRSRCLGGLCRGCRCCGRLAAARGASLVVWTSMSGTVLLWGSLAVSAAPAPTPAPAAVAVSAAALVLALAVATPAQG